MQWSGYDPDGRSDHYEYAIDPRSSGPARAAAAETTWVRTTANHVVARFHAANPDSLGAGATASEFHVFVLRALDARGGISPVVRRAFYAFTVAPDVFIVSPFNAVLETPQVTLPFRDAWQGNDPDGTNHGKPVAYRVKVVAPHDPAYLAFLLAPDSLLRAGFANGWAGWRLLPAESTGVAVTAADGLVPHDIGIIAVLAVDEAGATTPYLIQHENVARFDVTGDGNLRFNMHAPGSPASAVPRGPHPRAVMGPQNQLARRPIR